AVLEAGFKDLGGHLSVVTGYSVACAVAGLLYRLMDQAAGILGSGTRDGVVIAFGLFPFLEKLLFAMAIGAVSAMAFSILGRAIDYPVWRSGSARRILERYGLFWTGWYLLLLVSNQLVERAASWLGDASLALLGMLILVLHLFTIPVGACYMFAGGEGEFGRMFRPLVERPAAAAMAMLIAFLQFALFGQFQAMAGEGFTGLGVLFLVDLGLAWLDCLAFVIMWRACMDYRDSPDAWNLDDDF
ncbi:MAG TPA: hypothetical protein PKX28_07830, partial [Candidatus Hydrogenedentes bacterium]|nr:hypothetical protein [Candidatus Hydrogenedentota bacterium]